MRELIMFGADTRLLLRGLIVLILGLLLYTAVLGLQQWQQKHIEPPTETVEARVTGKRVALDEISYAASYYVTFQVVGGLRVEFQVDRATYRSLSDQSKGMLTYRGSRYLEFR